MSLCRKQYVEGKVCTVCLLLQALFVVTCNLVNIVTTVWCSECVHTELIYLNT